MAQRIPCIGLFGTCGGSTWREPFIAAYRERGIRYFNPQVDNWTPECADIEAQHLARDEIILFPVTGETYGTGSLAETGFSVVSVIASITAQPNRFVVILIEQQMDPALDSDGEKTSRVAFKESQRARRLIQAHLAANPHPNVYVVDDLGQMLALSLDLHALLRDRGRIDDTYHRPGALRA